MYQEWQVILLLWNTELHQENKSETRKVEESGDHTGAVSGEAVDEVDAVTNRGLEEAIVPPSGSKPVYSFIH